MRNELAEERNEQLPLLCLLSSNRSSTSSNNRGQSGTNAPQKAFGVYIDNVPFDSDEELLEAASREPRKTALEKEEGREWVEQNGKRGQ